MRGLNNNRCEVPSTEPYMEGTFQSGGQLRAALLLTGGRIVADAQKWLVAFHPAGENSGPCWSCLVPRATQRCQGRSGMGAKITPFCHQNMTSQTGLWNITYLFLLVSGKVTRESCCLVSSVICSLSAANSRKGILVGINGVGSTEG